MPIFYCFLFIFFLSFGYAQEISNVKDSLGDDSYRLAEIIVTADKSETNLEKTPYSISVLADSDIVKRRVWDIRDLSTLVPNLYASHPGDLRSVISIRGVSTTSYDPAVAVYVDGVNQFSLDTYISQLNDVDRIEILRGPQGTLYGRNASAGVINIITKQPNNELQGEFGFDLGNYGLQRYTGSFRWPLFSAKLQLGGSGMFHYKGGFFRNDYTGSAYDKVKVNQSNYFFKYEPFNQLSFILNIKHQLHLNKGAFPLISSVEEAFKNPFRLSQNRISEMYDKTLNISLNTGYSHRHFLLTSQTSFQKNYRIYKDPIDGDFSNYDIISIVNDYGNQWNTNRVYMQELRLSSPKSSLKLNWNVGVYGFIQQNPIKQGTYFGENADMFGSPISNFTDITINNLNGRGLAGFGQLTYHFNSKLSIITGLRYDYEDNERKIAGFFQPDYGKEIITRSDTSAVAKFQNLSPKLVLQYNFSQKHIVFGVFSKGFRAGGISELSSDPSEVALMPYDPEHSENFEIGSKSTFYKDRFRINTSIFYTRVKNGQIPVLLLPEALTIVRNAAKLKSKGAEIEFTGVFDKSLSFSYNIGLVDADYVDLNIADEGENKKYSGHKQIFTPQITSFFSVEYNRPIYSKIDFFVAGAFRQVGKQYFDLANSISQNSYGVFNTRTGVTYSNCSITFWASNLFDTRYIDYAYDFGAVHLAEPRTFGISFRTLLKATVK